MSVIFGEAIPYVEGDTGCPCLDTFSRSGAGAGISEFGGYVYSGLNTYIATDGSRLIFTNPPGNSWQVISGVPFSYPLAFQFEFTFEAATASLNVRVLLPAGSPIGILDKAFSLNIQNNLQVQLAAVDNIGHSPIPDPATPFGAQATGPTVAFALGTTYVMAVAIDATHMHAKWWALGDPEPSSYPVGLTSPGSPGTFNMGAVTQYAWNNTAGSSAAGVYLEVDNLCISQGLAGCTEPLLQTRREIDADSSWVRQRTWEYSAPYTVTTNVPFTPVLPRSVSSDSVDPLFGSDGDKALVSRMVPSNPLGGLVIESRYYVSFVIPSDVTSVELVGQLIADASPAGVSWELLQADWQDGTPDFDEPGTVIASGSSGDDPNMTFDIDLPLTPITPGWIQLYLTYTKDTFWTCSPAGVGDCPLFGNTLLMFPISYPGWGAGDTTSSGPDNWYISYEQTADTVAAISTLDSDDPQTDPAGAYVP